MGKGKEKPVSKGEAMAKAMRYCAYQERTHQEVRDKLSSLGLGEEDTEDLIGRLIVENFINEARYAKAYAGGKFRMKQWGRLKIVQGLTSKGITEYCIKEGLKEISGEEYEEVLNNLLVKRDAQEKEVNPYKRKYKLAAYLIQKGFEPDLVWDQIKANF